MNVKKHQIDNYKRFLLNRATTNVTFVEFVENLLAAEDETASHCFHKIMIHNWIHEKEALFDIITEYFSATLVPVDVTKQGDITTFYTSNLSLILRLMRLDFMFPYQRNMFNVDVLFYDKTSADFFDNSIKIDDVVSSVVSRRLNEKQMLDLSNFCDDQEFKDKKICFYKLSLLANFKILMLRIGKDTKSLNLSNNNLTQPPLDVMNFFIKGDLTEINLSYNNIQSISDLVRVSSKIEKLWVEGNPLCEDNEPSMYVKHITMKFPRLTELDGIKLNEFGLGFPFNRNFLSDPSRTTKMVTEKFLTLYFSHYDTVPRRKNIDGFYDPYCSLSFTCGFTDAEAQIVSSYATRGRNILKPSKREMINPDNKIYFNKHSAMIVFSQLGRSQHDPTTFTVDVLRHDKRTLILVVDGLFKDLDIPESQPNVFRFRRTFVFNVLRNHLNSTYHIQHEMFHIAYPTPQQLANSFKHPIRNMNVFELVNPDSEETETISKIFCHISQLKKEEAEIRLRLSKWDLKHTIQKFVSDLTTNKITPDRFLEDDDFSDSSSLIDDEMVD